MNSVVYVYGQDDVCHNTYVDKKHKARIYINTGKWLFVSFAKDNNIKKDSNVVLVGLMQLAEQFVKKKLWGWWGSHTNSIGSIHQWFAPVGEMLDE